ncbi:MAG: hypothetical protein GF344_03180, partial [Chitinivibrionales bacterium]|nr:hypothetical protein [Chitinivibrionales bacterium]MBD3356082.1 hypothetical protein [Chitinivibrionales bacterium]
MNRIAFLCIALLANSAIGGYENVGGWRWENIGPGGGGAMYAPSISPHSGGRTVFIVGDMANHYLSRNGGRTFSVMDFGLASYTRNAVFFHPTDSLVVFTYKARRIYRSLDGGRSFTAVAQAGAFDCSAIVADPEEGNVLFAAMRRQASTPILQSYNWGNS